jgi:hypothetical protein
MRSIGMAIIVAGLLSSQPQAHADYTTVPGAMGFFKPYQYVSGDSYIFTHHHRLQDQTMFGSSTLNTQAATSEETPMTALMLATPLPEVYFYVPWHARTFSAGMLRSPALEPIAAPPPSMSRLMSPGLSLGGLWTPGNTMHASERDLESIEWGQAEEESQFSLDKLMK